MIRVLKNYKIIPNDKMGLRKGKHCIISRYGDKILKIFVVYPQTELNDEALKKFHWGDYEDEFRIFKQWVRLPEATVIQNICWLYGLSTRVYEIVGIKIDENHKYFAQLQDEARGRFYEDVTEYEGVYEQVKELGKIYGFGIDRKNDVASFDVIGGKLIDFNTLHFYPDNYNFYDNHLDRVKAIIFEKAKYGKVYYQNEPRLGMIGGPRQSKDRIKYMKLDKLDFKGKSFMDLGCAGGFFCRYAKDRGASKVLGIDFEDVKGSDTRLAAYLISWELGYYDIDFEQMDLRVEKPPKADITMFASMNFHIGIPDWLPEITNEICVFEDNSKGRDAMETLKKMFRIVKLVGYGEDHGHKPLIWCWK